jgi:hypothetical protein
MQFLIYVRRFIFYYSKGNECTGHHSLMKKSLLCARITIILQTHNNISRVCTHTLGWLGKEKNIHEKKEFNACRENELALSNDSLREMRCRF